MGKRYNGVACAVEDCTTGAVCKGFCNPHYCRFKRYGDPLGGPAPRTVRLCDIAGCDGVHEAKGLCNKHYIRLRNYGAPDAEVRARAAKGAPWEFIEQAVRSDTDECVEWPYASNKGYGVVNVDGRAALVPRIVLERTVGPAHEDGMDAAHEPVVCHNRLCVNPRHLRWATRQENVDDMVLDGTRRGMT